MFSLIAGYNSLPLEGKVGFSTPKESKRSDEVEAIPDNH